MERKKNGKTARRTAEALALVFGSFCVALAVVAYMEPNRIVTGSVAGLSLILSEVFPVSVSVLALVLNLLCLLLGARFLGMRFGIKSACVSVLLPIFMEIIPRMIDVRTLSSGHLMLDVLFFLLWLTAGQCILFLSGTASGGLDIVAEIASHRTSLSTGLCVAIVGVVACLFAAPVYGPRTAISGILVTAANGGLIHLAMRPFFCRAATAAA